MIFKLVIKKNTDMKSFRINSGNNEKQKGKMTLTGNFSLPEITCCVSNATSKIVIPGGKSND